MTEENEYNSDPRNEKKKRGPTNISHVKRTLTWLITIPEILMW